MATPPVKKACDACHRRKIRCSGGLPCNHCSQANLQCTYLAIPQKKGPKGSRAKVISEIRVHQRQSHPLTSAPPGRPATATSTASARDAEGRFDFNSPPASPVSRNPLLLSRQTVENCVDFYFTNMTTTAWILSRPMLADMIASRLATDAEVYCLIASLCAFVTVQPGMNLAVAPGSHYEGEPPESRYGYAHMLLEDILRVRKSIDYVESPTLNSVLISFFLFSCYFTLDKQNVCWFHLREAATLAQLLGMHDESTYQAGDREENTYKRRAFWLVLVTERAYALERHRPLSLHPTIDLPTSHGSQEALMTSGFLHLIRLFSCIDDEFMALWNKAKSACSAEWLSRLQRQLTAALPAELNTTESQEADVRVTLHWLRVMVWQLTITNGSLSSSSAHSAMTFRYPVEVARDLVQDIQTLSSDAMEVHGVGLIEKLFDVACTLTDVISFVPLEPPALSRLPADNASALECLDQLVALIARLRAGSSRYLPLLLAKVSETMPAMAAGPSTSTTATLLPPDPTQMTITQGYAGAADNLPVPAPVQYATMNSLLHSQSFFPHDPAASPVSAGATSGGGGGGGGRGLMAP